MRYLTIIKKAGTLNLPLTDEQMAELLVHNLVYECGDGHDLHLMPDHEWDVDDVARLIFIAADHIPLMHGDSTCK